MRGSGRAYDAISREMAAALSRSVATLAADPSLTRPDLMDAVWLMEARFGGLGFPGPYDDFAGEAIAAVARVAYGSGEGMSDDITQAERSLLARVASDSPGSPYRGFLSEMGAEAAAAPSPPSADGEGKDESSPVAAGGSRLPFRLGGPEWEATLTAGQAKAFDAIRSGRNAFITGNGGTGKSYLLEGAIAWARSAGRQVIVCAPTGIAALNVGGSTVHRALGITPDRVLGPKSHPSLPSDSPLPKCDLMVVDEISMCRCDLFDYLSCCLRETAAQREAQGLGPCQLVVVGDFFQLPPVVTDDDRPILDRMYGREVRGAYPFMGDEWGRWGFERVALTEAIRQRDAGFVSALERCRVGDISGARWIESHAARVAADDAIVLCGTNAMAGRENSDRLRALPGPDARYRGRMWGDVRKQDMPTDMTLRLRVGARVMSVVNDVEGRFMNGSLGTVLGCGEASVTVMFDGGRKVEVTSHVWTVTKPTLEGGRIRMATVGEFEQVPLRLAWAITIHKSQGQTFVHAVVHPYCWDYGQLYTALSRLTDVGGLRLAKPIRSKYLRASPDVIAFEREAGG